MSKVMKPSCSRRGEGRSNGMARRNQPSRLALALRSFTADPGGQAFGPAPVFVPR